MANDLIKALVKSKETYSRCRKYLYQLVKKDKQKLESLEASKIAVCIPYLIKYIEEVENLKFLEVVNYYSFSRPELDYHTLVKISIVGCFRKIENNDRDFNPI